MDQFCMWIVGVGLVVRGAYVVLAWGGRRNDADDTVDSELHRSIA